MKILLHEWTHYMVEAIDNIVVENNISADRFGWKFLQDYYDDKFLEWFDANIPHGIYDFVLSVNYFPMLAIACNKKGYKYISWCYDCPFNITNPEETLSLDTNYCFVFDYSQYIGYKNSGINTVYHLPLGVDGYKVSRIKYNSSKAEKYSSDVSFVGVLYESQLPLILSALNNETQKILNELVRSQEELYNYNIFKECISDELIDYMNSQYSSYLAGTGKEFIVSKKALEFALSCEATRRNRIILLNLLAKRYVTKLYSYQTFDVLKGVVQCGSVDYREDMPYVFHNSKINLNPTLRCIETGVPLRAFDIMGFGGFLLSNYQQELADMYEDGKELVLYSSYEEAVEKVDYYLQHEDVRRRIALAGQEKTLKYFTLQHAFDTIINTIK